MMRAVSRSITESVGERDRDFRRVRTAQAVKQAGKTLAIGSAVFFASQEIMAAISPSKVGLLEKSGILKTQNNQDASETILAGLREPRNVQQVQLSGDNQVAINQLEGDGWTATQTTPPGSTVSTSVIDIDPSASPNRLDVIRDTWANNGTQVYDGNELRGYLQDGTMVSGLHGGSTLPDGQLIDYDAAAAAGRIKAYITVDGATFELAQNPGSGPLSWGANGVFTTTTGETIQAIGDNGEKLYKYFEIALDNGVDSNGVSHIIPLATDVGADTFAGKLQQVVETVTEDPGIVTMTREIPGFYGGVAIAPVGRTGLGEARSRGGSTPETRAPRPQRPSMPPRATRAPGGSESAPPVLSANETNGAPTEPDTPTGEGDASPGTTNGNEGLPSQGDTTTGANEGLPSQGDTAGSSGDTTSSPEPGNVNSWGDALIQETYGELVGPYGVELMTSPNGYNESDNTRISDWWGGLSDDARSAVIDFYNASNTRSGRGLRAWLQLNGLIELGPQ